MSSKPLPFTLACALYDRMQALYTGDVKPEGMDLTFKIEDFPRRLFDSAMANPEFDACEMSSSDFITRTVAGTCPFVALPVFPSKAFRHGIITINKNSGIETPKDLEGRKVGVMRYTMTAAVWQRGHLQNDYGVDPKKIHWVEGSMNSVGSHGVPTIIPPGVTVTVNESGKSLSDLLSEGKIDAAMGTHLPDSRKHNKDIVRLFPNFREVEQEYYRKTGIFPIMHLIVIRKDVYQANPWIAKSLYRAFVESKRAAHIRMRNYSALRYMLPWMAEEIDQIDELMGEDPWSYGVEANRANLETLVKFLVQQGMLKEAVPIDGLFVDVE